MSSVGITENVKGDNKKFEVWCNGREEVYIIQATSVELKNLWVSEIRKVLTGQLEACREASQLHQRISESVYHAPMRSSSSTRYSRKAADMQNKSDSSSPETTKNKNRTSSPNTRQNRVDASASLKVERSALAKKRFTLQGLSNRRLPSTDPEPKEKEVARRFSLASSLSTTSLKVPTRTKGPLGPDVKAKRHEIKSDPTPFGFEEAFQKSILVQGECNNTSITRHVPRSSSQTGWPSRHIPSLDTYEDFETIPSSNDELSNSSDMEDETHANNRARLFRVEGSFEACYPDSFILQHGDLVQFIQGGENGQWLVKEIVYKKTGWVPSSLLYPAEGERNNSCSDSKTDVYSDTSRTSLADSEIKDKKNELTKGAPAEQSVAS